MNTAVMSAEPDFTIQDAIDYLNPRAGLPTNQKAFERRAKSHFQRIGQLWFNQLSEEDQHKLHGSYYDPYESENWDSIIRALIFLMEN